MLNAKILPLPVLIRSDGGAEDRQDSPILLLRFGGSVGAAFSVLGRDVAALLERGAPVLQDVLDAELLALQARLRALPVAEGACQRLLGPRHRRQAASARRQDVDADSVHANSWKKKAGQRN